MFAKYTLDLYANDRGEIPPEDIKTLLEDAHKLGGDTAPLELIPGDDQGLRWGLRMRILSVDE